MHTTHFWKKKPSSDKLTKKDRKTKYFKVLGAIKLKGIIRIVKVGSGHLCLREKNICFDNNDIKSVGYTHVLVLKQDI